MLSSYHSRLSATSSFTYLIVTTASTSSLAMVLPGSFRRNQPSAGTYRTKTTIARLLCPKITYLIHPTIAPAHTCPLRRTNTTITRRARALSRYLDGRFLYQISLYLSLHKGIPTTTRQTAYLSQCLQLKAYICDSTHISLQTDSLKITWREKVLTGIIIPQSSFCSTGPPTCLLMEIVKVNV